MSVARASSPSGSPDRRGALGQQWSHVHHHLSTILQVADAARVARSLQSIEDRSDGRGRQPAEFRQSSGGHRALVLHDVEATQIGTVDAELLTSDLVERIVRRLMGPRQMDQLIGEDLLLFS